MTTPANTPVCSATAGGLIKLRGSGQFCRLGLAIQHAPTVYTARINDTFTTLDNVPELIYDGGSGTLADVLEGMTVWIGSAAGLHDKGITRARKTPSATVLYIAPTSHIQFANDDYITILNSFSIGARDLSDANGVVKMDYDIVLGDLTRGGIMPRLGPLVAVINQTSGTITFTPPNPSLSAGYDGATIASYLFSAPGASTTSNMTSPTAASWTYPLTANQEYRWSCAITDSLGRVTTSYRWVFINPTEIPFTLENCAAEYEGGDWSFEVVGYEDVSSVHDRALVTLYAVKDVYDGVAGAIGKLAGYENILASGWIDGESIEQDGEHGTVSFTVRGAAYWMSRIRAMPIEFADISRAETGWKTIQEMTVDKALARLIYWTSTAPLVMDIFLTGDTTRLKALTCAGGSLLDQIDAMAKNTIFAKPLVNNYGQMYIQVDPQIIDTSARAALTVVMDITKADYGGLELTENKSEKTAMVEVAAQANYDGTTLHSIYARAPGNTPKSFGQFSSYNNYVIADQNECKRIAGCLLANENNAYEPVEISFPANLRLFDIAPSMYATITTDAADNPRGIALTDANLIPRRVEYTFDDGILTTHVTFEVATVSIDGVEYFPLTVEEPNLDEPLPPFDDVDFPGFDDSFPIFVSPEVDTPCDRSLSNSFSLTFSPSWLYGSTSQLISKAHFPCMIRATGGEAGDTSVRLSYHVEGDAVAHEHGVIDHVTMYAVKDGARVLTGTWVNHWGGIAIITFTPVGDVEIDGFEIELDAGAGAIITRYEAGEVIEIGDMGTNATLVEIGKYYSIEAFTGHWQSDNLDLVGRYFYNVADKYNCPWYSGLGQGFSYPAYEEEFFMSMGDRFIAYERTSYEQAWDPITSTFVYNGKYGRGYFMSDGNPYSLFHAASTFAGTVTYYGMKWALREARALGRAISIGGAALRNVCAIPT